MHGSNIIKVLIIEDSKVFQEALLKGIGSDDRIEVVGTARDVFEGRDKILELNPDVLTLDIELPKMDGISFIKKLMPQYPLPIVVVSCHYETILEALAAGAVDFIKKPLESKKEDIENFLQELIIKIKIASIANVSGFKNGSLYKEQIEINKGYSMIAIGASTGGTEAVFNIIKALPKNMPGIVVVQHMPEVFTKMYAERLNSVCRLEVKEAESGDYILPGRVLIAPGGFHMKVIKWEGKYAVNCFVGEKVNGHRPSVDVLFCSAAKEVGAKAIGVILTGMGYDGAKGLLEMRKGGAITIGQDEDSCVVYGMPKIAFDIGGVIEQMSLNKIAQKLYTLANI